MRNFFTCLIFIALVLLQFNCAVKNEADNANAVILQQNNETAANADAPAVNTKKEETAVPEYSDADTAFAEGNKFLDAFENEKAVDAYRQAVKLNPDFAEAYFQLGIAYSLLDNDEEPDAKADAKPTPKRSKKSKKDAPLIVTKADKAFDNAVKAYKKILDKNPKDDAALFNLGRSYNKLNQDDEAEKVLKQAVKLQPDNSLYQTEYGSILIKLAHYDEAVKALKKAIELDESNLQAEELLEKAEAGKKRIDYGVNKIVKEKQQQ